MCSAGRKIEKEGLFRGHGGFGGAFPSMPLIACTQFRSSWFCMFLMPHMEMHLRIFRGEECSARKPLSPCHGWLQDSSSFRSGSYRLTILLMMLSFKSPLLRAGRHFSHSFLLLLCCTDVQYVCFQTYRLLIYDILRYKCYL